MTMRKKVLLFAGVLLVGVVLFCAGYWLKYAQGVIRPASAPVANATRHMLIGSQGSDYKQELVRQLAARLQAEGIASQIIDVTALPTVKETDYDAIILICSIEFYAAQKDVAAFIAAAQHPERIVLHTTSGQGDMPPQVCRIDAITGASQPAAISDKVAAIMARLPPAPGTVPGSDTRIAAAAGR
ncbi:MAG TPA: hypothetical protein PKM88_03640 [bacterium]|nr:hypothetical protein [bacterium]